MTSVPNYNQIYAANRCNYFRRYRTTLGVILTLKRQVHSDDGG
jgi:hypothetical protein